MDYPYAFCSGCGREIPHTWRFCRHCGQALQLGLSNEFEGQLRETRPRPGPSPYGFEPRFQYNATQGAVQDLTSRYSERMHISQGARPAEPRERSGPASQFSYRARHEEELFRPRSPSLYRNPYNYQGFEPYYSSPPDDSLRDAPRSRSHRQPYRERREVSSQDMSSYRESARSFSRTYGRDPSPMGSVSQESEESRIRPPAQHRYVRHSHVPPTSETVGPIHPRPKTIPKSRLEAYREKIEAEEAAAEEAAVTSTMGVTESVTKPEVKPNDLISGFPELPEARAVKLERHPTFAAALKTTKNDLPPSGLPGIASRKCSRPAQVEFSHWAQFAKDYDRRALREGRAIPSLYEEITGRKDLTFPQSKPLENKSSKMDLDPPSDPKKAFSYFPAAEDVYDDSFSRPRMSFLRKPKASVDQSSTASTTAPLEFLRSGVTEIHQNLRR